MARLDWQDRVYNPLSGAPDNAVYYNLVDKSGNLYPAGTPPYKLVAANTVAAAGTPHSAANDNLLLQVEDVNPTLESLQNQIDLEPNLASYLAFCGNVNANMLDSAFGKNNTEKVSRVGKQLAMYAWFMGENPTTYPYTNLQQCNTMAEIYNNLSVMTEVEQSTNLLNIISASPYATSIRAAALTESNVCQMLATLAGLSNPTTFTTVLSLTANASFMTNETVFAKGLSYNIFCQQFLASSTNWQRIINYYNAMHAFENSSNLNTYLAANKATALSYAAPAAGTTSEVLVETSGYTYIFEFIGDGGNWSCQTTITTSVTGKTFSNVGSGGGTVAARAFFHPCNVSRTNTSASFSAYYKKIS